jgi:hypothetical protein
LIAAGGEAFYLWAAWHFGGEDPWRLYNLLGADYRPIGAPDRDAIRPKNPRRLKAFMYACSRFSARRAGMVEKVMPVNRAQRRAAKKNARVG